MQRKKWFYEQFKGKQQGNIKIIDYIRTDPVKGKIWRCVCACGKEFEAETSKISSGNIQDCPECAKKKRYAEEANRLTKHGHANERLHKIWWSMISRCTYPTDTGYAYYGGKGIKIFKEWLDYANFREWAFNNGYKEEHGRNEITLDRIDSSKDYCPKNCRWVSMNVQALNRRNGGHYITVNGITMCIKHWAKVIGVCRATILYKEDQVEYIKSRLPECFRGYKVNIKGRDITIYDEKGETIRC